MKYQTYVITKDLQKSIKEIYDMLNLNRSMIILHKKNSNVFCPSCSSHSIVECTHNYLCRQCHHSWLKNYDIVSDIKSKIIAVDFDGTCVADNFPLIGPDIGAEKVLKKIVAAGHRLILWTVRSNKEFGYTRAAGVHNVYGKFLTEAVDWFISRKIELYSVNTLPEQNKWTNSPKVYCDLYIDDKAIGVPTLSSYLSDKPYVDWGAVHEILLADGWLSL